MSREVVSTASRWLLCLCLLAVTLPDRRFGFATNPQAATTSAPKTERIFTTSGVFVVPQGVNKLDVICIGAGGGGRDSHQSGSYGANGGNSLFGGYMMAAGGGGANSDDSGGLGGNGSSFNGGNGGIGGGCSAGAGAAGETSPGDGMLLAGSSNNPFCGGGGSSGNTTCGQTFYLAARSGPGGADPVGRKGGLYGGGGGSRAGGRAGGGAGYSRMTLQVTPGEQITVTVGQPQMPYYALPGQGIVVVSWGMTDNTDTSKADASTRKMDITTEDSKSAGVTGAEPTKSSAAQHAATTFSFAAILFICCDLGL